MLGRPALMLCILLLFACEGEKKAVRIDLQKKEAIAVEKRFHGLTYAYLPRFSHRISYMRHNALINHLSEETGLNIRQVFPDTFEEHVQMVGLGEIDISFSNPLVYVTISDRFAARAFARVIGEDGRTEFRGQIICREDNKAIREITDCRDMRWIAVDPLSAGGYLFALGHFRKLGIFSRDFRKIAFAPGPGAKQEKVVLAVYVGGYDVGSIQEGTLELVRDRVELSQIRILDHTSWYPGWVFSSRHNLKEEILSEIKQTMFALDRSNPTHRTILRKAGFRGIVPAADGEFDRVRTLADTIKECPDE